MCRARSRKPASRRQRPRGPTESLRPAGGPGSDPQKTTRARPGTATYAAEPALACPPAATAASAMNAIAHCVEGLWVAERTPVTVAYAAEAMRRFAANLPRAVAAGGGGAARA